MPKHKSLQQELPSGLAGDEAALAPERASAALEAAVARAWAEEQARLIAEEALARARQALAAGRVVVEEEHRARVSAEKALAEARAALVAAQLEMDRDELGADPAEAGDPEERGGESTESSPLAGREQGAERRVSFIIRLAVDERGQPRRTEVEHAQSRRKEIFLGLDTHRLVAFIEDCLGSAVISEGRPSSAEPALKEENPAPASPKPSAGLTIAEVGVFRAGAPGMAFALNAAEAFVVRVRFQLQGPSAPALAAQASPYEIQIYAHDVTDGTSALLDTRRGTLAAGVLDYVTQKQVSGLATGLYRLVTLVKLPPPVKMVAYHERPVIHVTEAGEPAPESRLGLI